MFFIPVMSALIILLTVSASSIGTKSDFEENKELIALRKIGHEVLLSTGDLNSRVLPIKQVAKREFQIEFEKPLSLQPDSIVHIVNTVVSETGLPAAYVANVLDCSTEEIVYGFSMSADAKNNVVPCLARTLPKASYKLDIKFATLPGTGLKKTFYIVAIILAILTLLAVFLKNFYKSNNPSKTVEPVPTPSNNKVIGIGNFEFYFEQQYLLHQGEKTELTGKESKLLFILASSPNLFIERKKLQEEVWENEGVIVTRSLDVFISRLRKKLSKDPAVQLVNVHGKGYKLEISSPTA